MRIRRRPTRRRPALSRLTLLGAVLALAIPDSVPAQRLGAADDVRPAQKAEDAEAPAGLREGWQWRVAIPAAKFPLGTLRSSESRVRMWVEKGWLIVRRFTADDELEWQVVLARASDQARPEIQIDEKSGSVDIRYRGYFIREAADGLFRIFRERKSPDAPAWPVAALDGELESTSSSGFSAWRSEDWRLLRFGPTLDRPDVWLRFQPRNWPWRLQPLNQRTRPTMLSHTDHMGGPVEIKSVNEDTLSGSNFVLEEGDLLIGSRVTPAFAAHGAPAAMLGRRFEGQSPPAVAGTMLSGEKPVSPDDLRGKIVVLHFWSANVGPSVQQLARLEALQKKYGPRGLVTIGIHDGSGSEAAAKAMKAQAATFPVLLDDPSTDRRYSGETAARYGVEVRPTDFLIDREGRFVWGLGMGPPPEIEIERLLFANQPAPELSGNQWFNASQPLSLDSSKGSVVLVTFLWRGLPGPRDLKELQSLADKFADRGLVVIGVYRGMEDENVRQSVLDKGITFPVLLDSGETAERYLLSASANGHFVIDKTGRLVGGRRGALPTPEELEGLLK